MKPFIIIGIALLCVAYITISIVKLFKEKKNKSSQDDKVNKDGK